MTKTGTKNIINNINSGLKRAMIELRSFLSSQYIYYVQLILACVFVLLGKEFNGLFVFAVLFSLILLFCEDILPTTLPFLLMSAMATNLYDSYDLFMPYVKFAPLIVVCIIYHFVVYRKKVEIGESVYGICAVSIAVILGGIGRFELLDYIYGSYYFLGLGIGMIGAYLLMKSQFSVRRDYDFRMRFSLVMTIMGIFCMFIIANGYRRLHLKEVTVLYPWAFSRNNISTMLMFAMPFPLYLAKKNKFLAILSLLFYVAISMTTSRGGLLCGGVEFAICAGFWVFSMKGKTRWIRLTVLCVCIVIAMLLVGKYALEVLLDRVIENDLTKDLRYEMLLQAIEKFRIRPISGFGLLDKTIAYEEMKKRGSLTWYHMMTSQIVGSMGLIGIIMYSYQIIGRLKLIFRKPSLWSICLGFSYFGILLMSQVNPGEFCPLPFELLTVLLFVLQEIRLEGPKPLYNDLIKMSIK